MNVIRQNDLYLIATAIAIVVKKKKERKRTKWVKNWLKKRKQYSHANLLNELRLEVDDYRNYLRMDENTYIELLHLVTPLIEKEDTIMRKAISPHERLSTTLRFLASGRCFEDLKFSAIISPQSLGKIIPDTCAAICQVLSKDYISFPTTESQWIQIAREFQEKWQFPHCLGAVDGKHTRIARPANSGSFFYNYKGFYSIVLLGIVNSNCEFLLVDVGTNGRISDGGVIENTNFYNKLIHNLLNIPAERQVLCTETKLPFVFIGDEAFALRSNFLKPFSRKELSYENKIYNYRLSRARNTVECAFGMLASRFRILHTEINLKLDKIEKVVLTCCVLHNFLRSKCDSNLGTSLTSDSNIRANFTITIHNTVSLSYIVYRVLMYLNPAVRMNKSSWPCKIKLNQIVSCHV
ncbi:putative nuclease HARBI1 [Onthophagus taurus]|uniref:putative nuclease HARBI1 n=1 Tax=Onthophagus taurus TaxID=166361 RepID=UPI0039BEA978